jgi:hypothetical protein
MVLAMLITSADFVACPYCSASPMSACTADGRELSYPHVERSRR